MLDIVLQYATDKLTARHLSVYPFIDDELGNLAKHNKISEIIELALKHPAEFADMIENHIKRGGTTMLMYAVHYGSGKVAKYLISRMKNINQQDDAGETALMLASSAMYQFKVVKMRVAAGCDITLKCDMTLRDGSGYTALDWAKELSDDTAISPIVEYLETHTTTGAIVR